MKKVTLTKSLICCKPNQKATAKSLRSNNPANVVKATIEGLKALRTAEEVAKIRDISVEQVKG